VNLFESQTKYGKNESFELQVARGQISGHTAVQILGYNNDVDIAWEPIWSDGTITFPTVATVMKISSSSTEDTAAGVGARTVVITGVDGNYDVISEIIILNGQTPVNTVNLYFRINGLAVSSGGSNGTASGTIYAGDGVVTAGVPATVFDQIPVGWNTRQTATYTVPAGYTAYTGYSRLTFGQASGTNAVWGRVTITGTNGVKMATVSAVANNGIVEFNPVYPIRIPEKTLIMAEAMGTATNNFVSTIIQILLVKNYQA